MCYAHEKTLTVGIMTFYVNTFMSISAHDAGGTASTALEVESVPITTTIT